MQEDKAILSTFFEYIKSLKSDSSITDIFLKNDPTASIAITGINENIYNTVYINEPIDNFKLIEELCAVQRELKQPLTAWITAETKAPGLENMLKERFKTCGAFYGMLLDVNEANLCKASDIIQIEEVRNQEQAEQYAKVFSEICNFPNLRERTVNWVIEQHTTTKPASVSFIAKIGGKIAGVSSLMLNHDFKEVKTGGLYNACVLPQFRKQGVGMEMACHRIRLAKALGLQNISIVLMSDAMARGYCERIGFKNQKTMTPYYIR